MKASFLLSILIFNFIYSFSQVGSQIYEKDTTPHTISIPKGNAIYQESKNQKYSFKPIYQPVNKYSSQKANAIVNSFNNAPAQGAIFTMTPEAQDYIASYRKKNETELLKMKSWGAFYLSSMENILVQNGIPKQLVYLSVIETHLNVNLVSWAGAAGMWQFMPETGRMYGLQIGNGIDERFDWYKSTYAACRFLRDLYNQFNDWLLVVAAYNGGPGRVSSAIKRSGSRNFWELQYFLPYESSNHVKKFIGTQIIMEGGNAIAGIQPTTPKPNALFNPLEKPSVGVDTSKNMVSKIIQGRYNGLIIAKYIMMDYVSFYVLNPNFDKTIAESDQGYSLRLPHDKMELFKANQLQIMNESLHLYLTLNNATVDTPKTTPVKKKGKKG